ncbi:MAG: type II toxin-antitoxin system RelE family toxin [Dolichospermum sp.]
MTNLNENINYTVVISIDAVEFFESASGTLQKKLDRCFERLKINPRNHPNIKSLKGELSGYYRYRVGDYRVIYEINDDLKLVTIIFIPHRSKVYQ